MYILDGPPYKKGRVSLQIYKRERCQVDNHNQAVNDGGGLDPARPVICGGLTGGFIN